MVRMILLFKQAKRELVRAVHPSVVNPVVMGRVVIQPSVTASVIAFMMIYIASTIGFTMLRLLSGLDFVTAFSAVVGTLKNIGWMQEDQESHTAIYAKGVGYDWSTQMTPVAGSTFDKVFVSCTDLDDNKVSCADQL